MWSKSHKEKTKRKEESNLGWEAINANELEAVVAEGKKPVPAGTYTLQLTGAFENKFRTTDTDVQFTIVDDGSFKGSKVYMDLPDPDRLTWSGQVYARLIQALGATVTPFAHPKEELNSLSKNGHSRLTADLYVEEYKRKDGTPGSKNRVNTKSLRPAA